MEINKIQSISSNTVETGSIMKGIRSPNNNDVLSGRGNFAKTHAGNEQFRAIVESYKISYNATEKRKRPIISKMIVDRIKELQPPGRFLKEDPLTKLWFDIGEKKALHKTRQALREGATDIVKQIEMVKKIESATQLAIHASDFPEYINNGAMPFPSNESLLYQASMANNLLNHRVMQARVYDILLTKQAQKMAHDFGLHRHISPTASANVAGQAHIIHPISPESMYSKSVIMSETSVAHPVALPQISGHSHFTRKMIQEASHGSFNTNKTIEQVGLSKSGTVSADGKRCISLSVDQWSNTIDGFADDIQSASMHNPVASGYNPSNLSENANSVHGISNDTNNLNDDITMFSLLENIDSDSPDDTDSPDGIGHDSQTTLKTSIISNKNIPDDVDDSKDIDNEDNTLCRPSFLKRSLLTFEFSESIDEDDKGDTKGNSEEKNSANWCNRGSLKLDEIFFSKRNSSVLSSSILSRISSTFSYFEFDDFVDDDKIDIQRTEIDEISSQLDDVSMIDNTT